MDLSSLPEAIAQTRNKQEGSAVLVMRSGVSEMNDQEIGAFRCGHTAELCGLFLLALDAADHEATRTVAPPPGREGCLLAPGKIKFHA